MKNLTIAGNLTRDSELRTVGGNGDKVLGFSVAVSEGFGDKKRTLYFDCSIWGKRAETLQPMLLKGTKVCVSGDMSTREHDGKTYLTLRVNDVTLQSGAPGGGSDSRNDDSGGQQAGGYGGGAGQAAGGGYGGRSEMDDEIPF